VGIPLAVVLGCNGQQAAPVRLSPPDPIGKFATKEDRIRNDSDPSHPGNSQWRLPEATDVKRHVENVKACHSPVEETGAVRVGIVE
jgi:hypothetical protein